MELFEDTLPDLYKVGNTDSVFGELDIVKGYHIIPEIPNDSDSLSLPSPISTFAQYLQKKNYSGWISYWTPTPQILNPPQRLFALIHISRISLAQTKHKL